MAIKNFNDQLSECKASNHENLIIFVYEFELNTANDSVDKCS